ncbi:MAG: DMT family transporter [Bacillota bacterium]|jgi:drug/metabolite transporter (DMT)-like permease
MQNRSPYLPLALGVIAVSFSAVFIKLSTAPSLVIASYRQLFATLILAPIAWWRYRREIRGINRRNLLLMTAAGVFLALHFATWISSFRYTTVAASTVLVSSQPIFVVILARCLFRQRINRRQMFSILIAVAGSGIIGLVDSGPALGQSPLWGNTLALLGAAFGAGYFLCGQAVRRDLPVLPYAAIVYGISALTLVGFTLQLDIPLATYRPLDFLLFLCLALFCSVIGHSALNWALAHMPAAAVGIAALGEPIGATIWAMIVFAEVPSFGQLAGGSLILAGILLFMQSSPAANKGEPANK